MVLHGRIEHGAVVLSEGVSLPDGTQVTIVITPAKESYEQSQLNLVQRVALPLVSSKQPGTNMLNAGRVAELLDEDDLSS